MRTATVARAPALPTRADVAAERARRAEGSLSAYVRFAWPILEPGTAFLPNWHMDLLCEYLAAVQAGQIRRLVINVPPRSLKSTIVTIDWPTWAWIAHPQTRWMFASYSQSLSEDHSVKRRTLLQSPWYQAAWGDRFRLADDQNQKREFKNDHLGVMIATSMGGTATGKGSDVLVLDDPHNPREAESDVQRTATIRDFDLTFSTRLNDPKTGAIVIVMQRLHEADLAAHCVAQGYTHVALPMRAEGPTRHSFPLSGRVVERADGDLLHPARWGAAEVAQLETALGPYGAAGQLQQRPAPLEGGLFKTHWWRFWHHPGTPLPPVPVRRADGNTFLCPCVPLPAAFDQTIQSWDMTFNSDVIGHDYVAGQVWATVEADRFLLDEVHKRLNFNDTCTEVVALAAKWPTATAKLVENKANGPAVMRRLQALVGGLLPVEPHGSKYARASATLPEVASGNVYLPHPQIAPWVAAFIAEHAGFPYAEFDDRVDARSQASDYLAARPAPRVRWI